ncbi:MAG: HEAT repeat domain-containing protein [Acidobacteriota bacterium]|nr:HEAT repeat domain-containing protein [Acidobacteriota bacterium]
MKIKSRMPFLYFPKQILPKTAAFASNNRALSIAFCFSLVSALSTDAFAQSLSEESVPDDYTMVYLGLVIIAAAVGLIFWSRWKKKQVQLYPKSKTETTIRRAGSRPVSNNGKERKVDDWIQAGFNESKKRPVEKTNLNGASKKMNSVPAKKASDDFQAFQKNGSSKETPLFNESSVDSSFWQLTPPTSVHPLPSAANDESVMDAIEQLKEEDDDEMMRSLAIRVLTAAKTRESVEGLSQVALYDASARHRIEAIMALAAFDHEAVFEPILLAGADPSREVRAAAARALSRLSFDRSDAFVRIIGCNDPERLRLAALACVESGFATRAFERLSSSDGKQSYEAFAILTLLVKAGEFRPIMQTIAEHPSLQVRLATVKVLHNLNSSKMSAALYELSLKEDLPEEVKNALKELLFHFSTAV